MWFIQKRGEEGNRIIQRFFTWSTDPLLGEIPCGDEAHSGGEAREFYAKLADEIADEFEINPCLDAEHMVGTFIGGPDPPSKGFCGDINSHLAQGDFFLFCPTRPSRMVGAVVTLASELERARDRLLQKALDGEFPA